MSDIPLRGREALTALDEEYSTCSLCPNLCTHRQNVVFGSGKSTGPILVVGESPGEVEDYVGVPYVGPAGDLLLDILAHAWPPDDELMKIRSTPRRANADDEYFEALRDYFDDYIFWTNVILCHPEGNRDPTTTERKNCLDRLHRTIYAVDPKLIIATGAIAATVLLGKRVKITESHGSILDIAIPSPSGAVPAIRYPMLVVYHPAALLRQGSQTLVRKKTGDTHVTIEDVRHGLAILETLYNESYGRSFLEPT